ncbi:MAG: hypothetical protein KME28_10590 [Pelatocladus maniniholoensis HA4357-MV3]|uniref:Uncharacterized protein n=1 Tax=Pelatocladus maniniholoensis HA4357-MV3 TaxID=1117104 RepID=A0A9E3H8J6_9NOST|nr:hypothetical protein [Pelatocladus maniniholoensis HA4357-MV3]BAZ68247.1 hypothetical protein NIES4106_30080 [Fischerella sp. NIES-4106]
MSRRKRSSPILEKADRRIAGFMSIDEALDLGNGLNMQAFTSSVENTREKLKVYNTILSKLDQAYHEVLEAEQNLSSLSERMMNGVASKFGKDSSEYEMAGGTRRKERRRRVKIAPIESS